MRFLNRNINCYSFNKITMSTQESQALDNDELYLLAEAVEKAMSKKFYTLEEVQKLFPIMNKYKNIVESIKRKENILKVYQEDIDKLKKPKEAPAVPSPATTTTETEKEKVVSFA